MSTLLQRCYVCKIDKSLEDFSADKTRPNGRMSRCKKCNNERVNKYAKSPAGRARHRRYQLNRAYGLSIENYNLLISQQRGLCAICKKHPKDTQRGTLYVDHNHKTGKVRGLLCGACNSSLGLLKENIETLESMIKYIKGFE